MKAAVVQQRAEAKDYIDINAILMDGRIDLPTALASAKAIYGRLAEETKDRLVTAARDVDLDRLPVIDIGRQSPTHDQGWTL